MYAAYETRIPVVYTCFVEVFFFDSRILEFLKFLLVWLESVCSFINVCLVIFKTT